MAYESRGGKLVKVPSKKSLKKLEIIKSVTQAIEYQQAWVNSVQLEPGYHQQVKDRFGDDLFDIFGPRDQRRAVRELSLEEVDTILKAVRTARGVPGVEKGRLVSQKSEIVSLPALQIRVFEAFQKIINPDTGKPVLYGLQLDVGDVAYSFASGVPTEIGLLHILTDIQRPINLERQMEYMLGNFDPALFTGVVGRVDEELGGIIVDDGQQGTVLTTAHGFQTIGVNFSVRQGDAEDARLLLVTNTYKLPMTPFEIYRNQIIVAKDDAMNFGIDNIKQSDKAAYNLNRIVTEPGTEIEFKFEGTGISAGQCNTVKQILKLFKNYAKSEYKNSFAFKQAIKAVKIAWPAKPITSEGIWAFSELFTQMVKQFGKKSVDDVLVHRVANIVGREFVSANKLWDVAKKARDAQYPKSEDANERYHGEGVKGHVMASMIVDLVHNYNDVERHQQGKPTVKDMVLPNVRDKQGRSLLITKSATTPDAKQHTRAGQDTKTIMLTNSKEVESFLDEAVNG